VLIELTPDQSEQLKSVSGLAVAHDPGSDHRYILIREEDYSRLVQGDEGDSAGELLEDLDPEILAAIEEGWAQSERGEGTPIEEVREMFRLKYGIK
jgi:hypothetical protein